jgi:hypoxanthine phosphoribosyltransferase
MFDGLISSSLNPTPELNANNTRKLISYSQLQEAIKNLADTINTAYSATLQMSEDAGLLLESEVALAVNQPIKKEVVVLCVMNGGMVFCAHLLPLLNFPLQFDALQISRYGDKDIGGALRWLKKPTIELRNKHILIVDDLIDEGVSLTEVFDYCEGENSASTKTVVLLNKDTTRRVSEAIVPNYIGLSIPDEFIFGFGIDYKNYYRNLLDIYSITD